jgi:hypothetical protein
MWIHVIDGGNCVGGLGRQLEAVRKGGGGQVRSHWLI